MLNYVFLRMSIVTAASNNNIRKAALPYLADAAVTVNLARGVFARRKPHMYADMPRSLEPRRIVDFCPECQSRLYTDVGF